MKAFRCMECRKQRLIEEEVHPDCCGVPMDLMPMIICDGDPPPGGASA